MKTYYYYYYVVMLLSHNKSETEKYFPPGMLCLGCFFPPTNCLNLLFTIM